VLPLYGERVLETKNNKISVAVTLTSLNEKFFRPNGVNATFFGSYLFSRRVSGVRVVNSSDGKLCASIGESRFVNYGSHSNEYPHLPYFTCAAAIGQAKSEVDVFVVRMREAFEHFLKGDPSKILEQEALLVGVAEEAKEESKGD